MKKTISKYARPVEFIKAKEEEKVVKERKGSSGDEIASLYQSITSTKTKKTVSANQDSLWCSSCQLSVPRKDHKRHIQGTAHMVSQDTVPSADMLVLRGDNVGFHMLRSQGWQYEQGLGKEGQGKRHPVATVLKRDRLCLGHKEQRSRKRVTHSHEEIEKEKKWQSKEKGKEWARKARLESKERVALLHYLKD
ncbi:hypothetical protein G6F60_003234 [Rhizopus arrhizus]|nr:hypothetical protein G6F60_003234 [Rhizopus arrhizus]